RRDRLRRRVAAGQPAGVGGRVPADRRAGTVAGAGGGHAQRRRAAGGAGRGCHPRGRTGRPGPGPRRPAVGPRRVVAGVAGPLTGGEATAVARYVITPDVALHLAMGEAAGGDGHQLLAPTPFRPQVLSGLYRSVRGGRARRAGGGPRLGGVGGPRA